MYSTTDASNFVAGTDLAFYIIIGISALFFVSIMVVMLWFVYRYNQKRNPTPTEMHGNNTLEILWTVIPTLLALLMFYYGWTALYPIRSAPDNALGLNSVARLLRLI